MEVDRARRHSDGDLRSSQESSATNDTRTTAETGAQRGAATDQEMAAWMRV